MIVSTNYSATVSGANVSDKNQTADERLLDESCNRFARWNAPLICVEICTMSCIIILNLLGLISLLRPNQKINPSFKIYIGNLLLANLSFAILENPLDLLYELSCDRWVMSWAICDLFIYCNYAVAAWAMHAHVLITLNRLWAVVFPYSYRRRHSLTVALLLCCGAFAYVHVWILPGVVLDSQFYRDSMEELQCELNTDIQKPWAITTQLLLFLTPIVFVAVSYIFIVVKLRSMAKVNQAGQTQDIASSLRPISSVIKGEKLAQETGKVKDPNSNRDHPEKYVQQNKRAFFILTSLTCSVIITWTPYEIHKMLAITGFSVSGELKECLDLWWTAQAILDPLLSTPLLADLKRIGSSVLRR